MADSNDAVTTKHADVEDLVDEFCYELAMALRRILGLFAPWTDPDEEGDDGDATRRP
jgi:hypothetical protein